MSRNDEDEEGSLQPSDLNFAEIEELNEYLKNRQDAITGFERGVGPGPMTVAELKRRIEQMCTQIWKVFGPGHTEKVYHWALLNKLRDAHIVAVPENPVPFYLEGECVGIGYADIIVQRRLILELKSVSSDVSNDNINQCQKYMRATQIKDGLVINFPQHKNRKADVDIYDCALPGKFIVTNLSTADAEKAESGSYGPAPRGGRRNQSIPLEQYVKHVKRSRHQRHDDEDNSHSPTTTNFGSIVIKTTNGTTTTTVNPN